MTFEQKFQSLKVAFDKADVKKFDTDFFAVQVTMTDEDCGGTFYIEYKDGVYSVEPYNYYDNTAAVIAPASAVAKLAKGTIAKDLFVSGNEENVKTLAASLKPAKKPTTKKATTAKAEEKKAPAKKATTAKAEEKKAPAKKTTTAKAEEKKAPAKKTTTAKKPAAKSATVKKDTKAAK